MRIHILGGPGAGVSTFGKALAQSLGIPYFDVDDFYWFTDDPLPYKRKRNPDHRRKLLQEALSTQNHWVLGGALCGWGDVFISSFDRVIFLDTPGELRLKRIEQREKLRYGPERLQEGGDLSAVYEKFLQWAAAYDENPNGQRNLKVEMKWLSDLTVPVIRLKGDVDLASLLNAALRLL